MNPPTHARSRQRGFTLIELMIVISILGLLAVVFLPDIIGAQDSAQRNETEVRLLGLQQAIDSFERSNGHYPPDDFSDPARKLQCKPDNGTNTGIESLLVFLYQKRNPSAPRDIDRYLVNTDGDQNGPEIPRLERSDRPEMIDSWGNPIAYFCAFTGGMKRVQRVVMGSGEEQRASAWKHPTTGSYLGGRRYQLVSAGPDARFNTGDDLTVPALPLDSQ